MVCIFVIVVGLIVVAWPRRASATTFPIPHGFQGFLTVTAFDTSGNESVEDGTAPFDVLAPGVPSGIEVR